ncbi:GIY-YIG nuclease family protein [Streptomyces europaeiscabiei]|uniref:GIY-YIG nuclease family protein n=1 Tax=Streptomyces europaeiscabiei TaxID=146819 RepID=UPI0029A7D42B|nr:GIY-YIG nuclease family protein [Streptomyces europaeiscabiei]MDX2528038.1 GIY-YIG nuclease family protein [Streptomyces europaeiscabiei]MDX3713392.1 GIY-YIG nuclease family protein [Streptomyces europaeiscabiei]
MSELTVKCGCGRTMNPDGRRGHGAYRCGCGLAIQISGELADRGPRCVGEDAGKPCRAPVLTEKPLRLCRDHYRSSGLKQFHEWITLEDVALARAAMDFRLQDLIDNASSAQVAEYHRRVQEAMNGIHFLNSNPQAAAAYQQAGELATQGVVYFIRFQNTVKIGRTTNVKRRLEALATAAPGAELLATEPGWARRERLLHSKFAFYRTAGEWFALGPGLVDYINKLRKAAGQPPIDVPPEHVDKIRSTL